MKKLITIALLVAGIYGLYTYVIAPNLPTADCPVCEGSGQIITKEPALKGGVKIEFGPQASLDSNGQMQVSKPQTNNLSAPRERKIPCPWCTNGKTTPNKVEEIKKQLEKLKDKD
ncbi:MAG: hypothetical protein HY819_08935 [Acidobacteria bacterium]|nr:hypothetical protein [Acidobacteriota bacterium]